MYKWDIRRCIEAYGCMQILLRNVTRMLWLVFFRQLTRQRNVNPMLWLLLFRQLTGQESPTYDFVMVSAVIPEVGQEIVPLVG